MYALVALSFSATSVVLDVKVSEDMTPALRVVATALAASTLKMEFAKSCPATLKSLKTYALLATERLCDALTSCLSVVVDA